MEFLTSAIPHYSSTNFTLIKQNELSAIAELCSACSFKELSLSQPSSYAYSMFQATDLCSSRSGAWHSIAIAERHGCLHLMWTCKQLLPGRSKSRLKLSPSSTSLCWSSLPAGSSCLQEWKKQTSKRNFFSRKQPSQAPKKLVRIVPFLQHADRLYIAIASPL